MKRVGLIGLCKIELPGSYEDVLLCDGGFIVFDGDTYRSKDPVFGTIGSVQAMQEGVGNEVPALEMVLLPPGTSEPGDLTDPGWQTSRVRFWIGEYDVDTGALDGTPDVIFDGQLDRTMLTVGTSRELAISIVSLAERLFELNTGNSLNPTWHKSVWPGELGHDNATGLSIPVAWGVESPRAVSTTSPYHSPRDFREHLI
jgi:hypothetical protein